jgi:hypothetical protein
MVGKVKLFWFFSFGFMCWQKPNVLDLALAFQLVYNFLGYEIVLMFYILR